MKKESQIKKIGEVINAFYKNHDLLQKKTNQSLFDMWKEIIGFYISSKTNNIVFKNNIIYIYIEDQIIKKELNNQKEKIKDSFLKKIKNLKELKII